MKLWPVVFALGITSVVGEYCQGAEYYIIPDGRDYRGTVNVTSSGITCQKWSSQTPHEHQTQYPNPALGIGDNNYCRNPFGDSTVGCFTMDPDVPYEECDIGNPCTPTPAPSNLAIGYSLPNGTTLAYDTFLCLTCTEACDLYFTIDGTVPSRTQGIYYQHCFTLSQSSRVRAVAYFVDGSVLIGDQYYGASNQLTNGTFYPPPGTYTSPVLLFVYQNATIVAADVFFPNITEPTAVSANGSWFSQTGYAAAVKNNELVAAGNYEFAIPSPQPPTIFPSSGTFFGGVNCLVYPLPRLDALFVSLNNSAYSAVTGQTFSLTTVGTTTLRFKAVYFDGTTSTATFELTVLDEPTATCTPAPGEYNTAINVTCSAPRGDATILRTWTNTSAVQYVVLSEPGTYNMTVYYSDDTNTIQSNTIIYVLAPKVLDAPILTPCGGQFAFLGASVITSVQDGGFLQVVEVDNVRIVNMSTSALVLTTDIAGNSTVNTRSVPISNPMLAASNVSSCVYSFYGYGSDATKLFRASFTVNKDVLSTCLFLPPGAIILSTTLGTNEIISLPNLPTALVPRYDQRLGDCLSQQGPTSAAFSGVMSYTLSTTVSRVGESVTVIFAGVRLTESTVKMVQDQYSCNDIGVLLQATADGTSATFQAARSGSYRLCAVSSGSAYSVPGPLLFVAAVQAAATVVPCGGVVTKTQTVTINAADGTLISVNGGQWYSTSSTTIRVADLPMVLSAVNGDASIRCVFYGPTSPPTNVSYRIALNDDHSADVVIDAVVKSDGPLYLSVQDTRCTLNTTSRLIPATQLDASIVADFSVTGALPPNPVVCLSSERWSVAVLPSSLVLTSSLLLLHSCATCSSGLCFANNTCACGTTTFSLCVSPAVPNSNSDADAPTWVRVVMAILFFTATVAVWIVFRGKPLKNA
ncbi:Hypothetical protein, putative [Bodo saltans]|uniref:Kringle domain-containing protein n=1 Tax=Bodo saltans TaxID=75058 RepID=A0A0S4JWM3_BODSA|nr:Hypothetical protein, putative [Bodo saltans]|eukprot:CUG93534.1 Hypothetical protein, putative [Bodo saltans]